MWKPTLAFVLFVLTRPTSGDDEVELSSSSSHQTNGGPSLSTPQQRVFALEHSLDDGLTFTPRGTLVITPGAPRSKVATMPTPVRLAGANATALAALCYDQDDGPNVGGTYRVRARATIVEGADATPDPWCSTSIPACDLFALGFVEALEAQVDARVNLLSLSFRNIPSAVVAPPPRPAPDAVLEFSSSASLALDLVAQVIPIQLQAAKPPSADLAAALVNNDDDEEPALGEEGLERSKKRAREKQGFFSRYWHVIIPVTLIVLTAKGEPPAEGTAAPGAGAPAQNPQPAAPSQGGGSSRRS